MVLLSVHVPQDQGGSSFVAPATCITPTRAKIERGIPRKKTSTVKGRYRPHADSVGLDPQCTHTKNQFISKPEELHDKRPRPKNSRRGESRSEGTISV